MKLLICLMLALAPLGVAKRVLTWEAAKVESCFHQVLNGAHYVPYQPGVSRYVRAVHESIYIDAGEWLYHVSREVTARGMLRLKDGEPIEVAIDGKMLVMIVGGKQYRAKIEQRSRGREK